jgi:hypothetical protein
MASLAGLIRDQIDLRVMLRRGRASQKSQWKRGNKSSREVGEFK